MIARLIQADEDTVREVIHRFNEIGLACLDHKWAGGRPRLLTPDDEEFVIQTATARPTKLGQPFSRWSIRKLAAYLRRVHGRVIRIGREALRCLLLRRGITFQRTKTWKEFPDLERDAKLDRIEHVLEHFPDRSSRSTSSARWESGPPPAPAGRSRANPAGSRRPTAAPTASPTSTAATPPATTPVGSQPAPQRHRQQPRCTELIRAARPDGAPIYIILDNLSAHTGADIRRWAKKNKVELCFTPTYASWANPIEAHFGPLRQFTLANTHHHSHPAQTQALHAYLRWRNANPRHPDVLAAQCKERVRIRSEKGMRWGGRPAAMAA
ncbi:IS630 family transposase [Streptomyces cyaneochromogenes]|uniref:IS630 family transposase n=1 Tax=Streptomyces cyaneochromogenes TaxID=2496836 RepID=UPI00225E2128|nr:IS630 family transposase [Streptomyces cyaneochromogenes]